MVEYLQQIPEIRVVIIDNDSKYPPLLEWYDTNPCEIERLDANWGNFVCWSSQTAIEGKWKPDFLTKYREGNESYIVTDSDLILEGIPLDFLDVMKKGLETYEWACKVGFSLEIADLPNTQIANEARGWEGMNWHDQTILTLPYRKCPVDTTFALVRGYGEPNDFDKCIRLDRPYCAKHAGWYFTDSVPEDEAFYLSRITADFNHYSIRNKNHFGL